MKVWKETLNQIIEDNHTTQKDVSKAMGYDPSHISARFSRNGGRGYAEFKRVEVVALCSILNTSEEALKAIPMSRAAKQDSLVIEQAFNGATKKQIEELKDQMTAGFAMLHADIRNLIDTIDKYWKPAEPKYEVKEREQP